MGPNMKVEWFWNGKPLSFKTRFTPIYDFGYVAMNFGWVYPEDAGEYICRATNQYGSDETRAIIKCSGKTGIVYESQLPKGMMSIEKIREMESGWQREHRNCWSPSRRSSSLASSRCPRPSRPRREAAPGSAAGLPATPSPGLCGSSTDTQSSTEA